MTKDDRVLLAEFVGWTRHMKPAPYGRGLAGEKVEKWADPSGIIRPLPNPLTSHADCQALIEALIDAGWCYMRESGDDDKPRNYVQLSKDGANKSNWGDDYREGIVSLAIPIAKAWAQKQESSQNWHETLSGGAP
jgi:hypothetical protein